MPDRTAWRVDYARWAAQSFSGDGAAVEGGRWNPAGVKAVYVSEHLAMAAQEKFVHLPHPLPRRSRFVKFSLRFGRLPVRRLTAAKLPADWRTEPAPESTQAIAAAWFAAGPTAILAVPSALIPEETNYVLNPAHPDFLRIKISAPATFEFDPRMTRLIGAG